MSPHDYGDWTRVEYYDGTSQWYHGHHFSFISNIIEDTDAVATVYHYKDGAKVRMLKLGL